MGTLSERIKGSIELKICQVDRSDKTDKTDRSDKMDKSGGDLFVSVTMGLQDPE